MFYKSQCRNGKHDSAADSGNIPALNCGKKPFGGCKWAHRCCVQPATAWPRLPPKWATSRNRLLTEHSGGNSATLLRAIGMRRGRPAAKLHHRPLAPRLLRQMKIPSRVRYVVRDLFPQSFDRGEFLLIAEALQEAQFDLGLRGQRNGMEVEQVALDGK